MEWRRIIAISGVVALGAVLTEGGAAAVDHNAAERAGANNANSNDTTTTSNGRPVAIEQDEFTEGPFTVEQIDRQNRQVVVRGPDGNRMTVDVSPNATGFDKLRDGERVQLDYYHADVVSLAPANGGQPQQQNGQTNMQSRGSTSAPTRMNTAPGSGGMPHAQGQQVTTRAQVTSLDQQRGIMQVRTQDGRPQTLYVRGAQRQAMRDLKVGENVDVTYVAPVTVALHPAASH